MDESEKRFLEVSDTVRQVLVLEEGDNANLFALLHPESGSSAKLLPTGMKDTAGLY